MYGLTSRITKQKLLGKVPASVSALKYTHIVFQHQWSPWQPDM